MGTLYAERIRTAIREVVTAALPTTFAYGAFAGQPLEAQQAMVRQTAVGTHRFDVELGAEEPHAASPVSARDPRRVLQIPVTIPVWSHVGTTAQEDERALVLNAISSDCDDVAQALAEPDALAETAAAAATGIVSGIMFGPNRTGTPVWQLVQEDWANQLVRSAITGALIVEAS